MIRRTLIAIGAASLLLLAAGCGDDDDDTGTALDEVEDTAEDTAEDTGMDDGASGEIPAEACAGYATWEQETGDPADLAPVRSWAEETDRSDIVEALDALDTQDTSTADGQAAYEGAVDFIRGELVAGGCDIQ